MLFELVIFVMSRLQKIDQHFLAVRFVGTIHEEFLGFRSLERITGEAIASAILDVLPKWNFNTKVYMTQKIISAYLKGLSKYRRMAFFFLKYLFSF